MKLLDLNHPFFKPVWVRVAVVAVCFVWGLIEFANGSALWGVFFVGLAVICGYRFTVIDYAAMPDTVNATPQDDE
jgi:hypothetical protein